LDEDSQKSLFIGLIVFFCVAILALSGVAYYVFVSSPQPSSTATIQSTNVDGSTVLQQNKYFQGMAYSKLVGYEGFSLTIVEVEDDRLEGRINWKFLDEMIYFEGKLEGSKLTFTKISEHGYLLPRSIMFQSDTTLVGSGDGEWFYAQSTETQNYQQALAEQAKSALKTQYGPSIQQYKDKREAIQTVETILNVIGVISFIASAWIVVLAFIVNPTWGVILLGVPSLSAVLSFIFTWPEVVPGIVSWICYIAFIVVYYDRAKIPFFLYSVCYVFYAVLYFFPTILF
jgi:hypothetical protein